MIICSLPFVLLLLAASPESPYQEHVVFTGAHECRLIRDPEGQVQLGPLVKFATEQGCYSIRIQSGLWELWRPLLIHDSNVPIQIRGESDAEPTILKSGEQPTVSLARARDILIENLVVVGGMELEETENIYIQKVIFRRAGLWLKGKRCNQPNECSAFNRLVHVEQCTFEDCEKGIHAERMEDSTLRGNRFVGEGNPSSCDRIPVGIELDGSSEDLDRPLEQGHSKANQVSENVFDQESAIGIRVKDSLGNVFRENQFHRSFRALEFLDGARYNQILSSHISYLSQMSVTSACPAPCGIYLGPGTVNNIFVNNFFEQDFELQFLERNRNHTFVIDESGSHNVFRSDFLRITP